MIHLFLIHQEIPPPIIKKIDQTIVAHQEMFLAGLYFCPVLFSVCLSFFLLLFYSESKFLGFQLFIQDMVTSNAGAWLSDSTLRFFSFAEQCHT